eukprot:scaffold1869_cov122-Cylindrotheca_fusiformis.AAC.51
MAATQNITPHIEAAINKRIAATVFKDKISGKIRFVNASMVATSSNDSMEGKLFAETARKVPTNTWACHGGIPVATGSSFFSSLVVLHIDSFKVFRPAFVDRRNDDVFEVRSFQNIEKTT